MSSKVDNEKQKLVQEKCQIILGNLLREEDNKYCVDCDAKCPRWASWNIGIFVCIRCAGIHRNLGVHISRVKSVSLDTWTPDQVASLQQMGNSQARAVYEANLPDSFKRPQADAPLEAFIRAKYELKKYIAKDWIAPKPGIEDGKLKEREKKYIAKDWVAPKPVSEDGKLKEREKKTNKVEIKALSQPLPSPKVSESVRQKSVPKETSKPAVQQQMPVSVDLFNLGESTTVDDDFGEFLSAPMRNHQDAAPITNISAENSASKIDNTDAEADFFNQKSDGITNKFTKESILSLYTSNTTCPVPSHEQQPSMYGIPAHEQLPSMYGIPSHEQIAPMYGVPAMYAQQPVAMTGYPDMASTGINPVQQQLANLQLSGPSWNVAGNVPVNIPINMPVNSSSAGPGNLILGSNQPMWPPVNSQNQNFSKNIWQ